MSEKKLLKTEAEIYENGWKKIDLVLTEQSLYLGSMKILLREIEDLELVTIDNLKCIKIKKDGEIIFTIPEKLLNKIYRFLAYNLRSDRFAVYFLSPATVGGVVVKDVQWEKGYLSITDGGIWFLSPKKQVRISLENLGSVDRDVRTVGGKQRVVLVVSHVENSEVVTSFILCPETTLEMLGEYIQRLIDSQKPQAELTEIEKQILTLIYSGLDSASVESIIGISSDELNEYYDNLVNQGLARVVRIRKELELTPKGVSLVSDIQKSQNIVG
jgi:hypothetical protein